MTKWASREAPGPRNPAKDNPETVTSAPIIPQNEDRRRLLFLIRAKGLLDFLNQLGKALDGEDWL